MNRPATDSPTGRDRNSEDQGHAAPRQAGGDQSVVAPASNAQANSAHVAPPKVREDWIDIARGASVLLVVFYHVGLWHLPQVATPGLRENTWNSINDVAGGIRMPLLLLLSGMLGSGKIRRGRPALRAVLANYWLYLVWLTVYALIALVLPMPSLTFQTNWAQQLLAPDTTLWYVFALACYYLVEWLCRPLPSWLLVLLLLAPILLIDPGPAGRHLWLKVPILAFYFSLGVHIAPMLKRWVHERAWLLVVIGAALYLVAGRVLFLAHGNWHLMQLDFVVGNLGKGLAALGFAWYAAKLGPLSRLGSWIGKHTLSIYVLHPVLLGLVLLYAAHHGSVAHLVASLGAAAVFYPVLLVAAIAAVALGLEQVLRRVGATALWGLPKPVMRRVTSWESQRPAIG